MSGPNAKTLYDSLAKSHREMYDRLVEPEDEEVKQWTLNNVVRDLIDVKNNTRAFFDHTSQVMDLLGVIVGEFERKTSPYERVEIELRQLTKIHDAYEEMKSQRDKAQEDLKGARQAYDALNTRIKALEAK